MSLGILRSPSRFSPILSINGMIIKTRITTISPNDYALSIHLMVINSTMLALQAIASQAIHFHGINKPLFSLLYSYSSNNRSCTYNGNGVFSLGLDDPILVDCHRDRHPPIEEILRSLKNIHLIEK